MAEADSRADKPIGTSTGTARTSTDASGDVDSTDRMAAVQPEAIVAGIVEGLRSAQSEPPGSGPTGGPRNKGSGPPPAPEAPTAFKSGFAARAASAPPFGGLPVAASVSRPTPLAAYELLTRSARLADLVSMTQQIVSEGARARVHAWAFTSKVQASAEEVRLPREDAETPFGNALDVLGTGGTSPGERALASALWAHAVAESPRHHRDDEDRLAADILWLGAHTAFDATPLLDRALGEDASLIWAAIAHRVRRITQGNEASFGRAEAVLGCAALAASDSPRAKATCEELRNELSDPVLLRVLATMDGASPEEVHLEGEMSGAPRSPLATTLMAITGLLFVINAARLVARLALAYRAPAEVSITDAGVRVKTHTELLGRTLFQREHVILHAALMRVVREVRFPRVGFYAGLLALAAGSYVGVRAFVDGVRAASPSLLVVGLLIIAIGIAADFVLGTLLPGSRGRCRLTFVPRTGPVLCIGDVDARRADDALKRSLGSRRA